ncbi:ABC transporter permease [Paludibacterium paludis]|uniref:ABC transporter permease n=1 Tax=Paludibacterium paludis TaxID=1225769 RepID=A0A918P676_9NEIS|nr:ABC-2 family transporter protein [Paludibacterium paludis]GGY24552.1 ABC transporter permease [Paludibacterium paludis]
MMTHYLSVVRMALMLGLKRSMQYRWDFLIEGSLSLAMAALQLLPLLVLFSERSSVAGWSVNHMLVLMGWYMMVRALVEGVVAPGLAASVAGIRTGQFDYTLIKPVDSLFLCSLAELKPWKIIDFLFGLGLAGYALSRLDVAPSAVDVLLAAVLSVAGVAAAYALFVLAVAASFVLVRIQNLTNVLSSFLDFARWPIQAFDPVWRLVFSVVIPLGVMTSYPVMALLGMLSLPLAAASLAVAALFFAAARLAWSRALRGYRSASS